MDDHARGTIAGGHGLAELVAARLCHDLNNPLGAIGNGVELLEMTGGGAAELSLISDAVRDAQARVKFLRLAFGAAPAAQVSAPREAQGALAEMLRNHRLKAEWLVKGDLPRSEVRLGCLMVLCAETALPMGGHVALRCAEPGAWALRAEGPRLSLDAALWSVLRFGPGAAGRALQPAEVQFPALHLAAEALGRSVNYRGEAGVLEMSTN